jgi:hypothetical protein
MPATLQQGASIYAVRTRVCTLDPQGYIPAGGNVLVSSTLVKANVTPVLETGDDIAVKGASGDLIAWNKHGDMVKYGTLNIEFATPDANLQAAIEGGVILDDTSAALGTPSGVSPTPFATGGALASGTYAYRASQFSRWGESEAEAEVLVTVTGPTGQVQIACPTLAAGALGARIYGRNPGSEELLGTLPNIGSQTTSAASGTGSVTVIDVNALTEFIPAGSRFIISADPNTVTVVFTVAEGGAAIGSLAIPVVPVTVTVTIPSGGTLTPVLVDTGTTIPSGHVPTSDLSAGPGDAVGYQAPTLGPVANPNGVSVEFWTRRIIDGQPDPSYPFYRWVFPKLTGAHPLPFDVTNANLQTITEGQSWENPNWGDGPFSDWGFDSSRWHQFAAEGPCLLPDAGVAPVGAGV